MSHFIPTREADAIAWFKNFNGKIKSVLVQLGMPEALADAIQVLLDAYMADYDGLKVIKANAQKATVMKDDSKQKCTAAVLNLVSVMKKSDKWTAAFSKDLQTDSLPNVPDRVNYKPRLKAKVVNGRVQLSITRFGAEATNVYTKLQSDPGFTNIGRCSRKSWVDPRPLDPPGIAQIRQYLVRGVDADEEFGNPSDIITITFGG